MVLNGGQGLKLLQCVAKYKGDNCETLISVAINERREMENKTFVLLRAIFPFDCSPAATGSLHWARCDILFSASQLSTNFAIVWAPN